MGYFALQYHLDVLLFILAAGGCVFWASRVLRRGGVQQGIPTRVGVLVLLIAAGTIALAVVAGNDERRRLETMVSGLAPTYAVELHRAGHNRIDPQTPPDDPTYLNLIELQKRWLALNPTVADIYTFGKTADGIVMLVDSETDYDRNGRIEGEIEHRTAIGEVYESELAEAFEQAWAGAAVFDPEPTLDRWGVWVSAYAPLVDDSGKVYAVLGVDYAADSWIRSILMHRAAVMAIGGVLLGIQLNHSTSTTLLRAEVGRRRQAEAELRASEARMRMIVDNEPECVVVVDSAGVLLEINPAGERLAQASAKELRGQPFAALIHPDHQAAFAAHHERVLSGKPGMIEFAMVGLKGSQQKVWMETHSVPLQSAEGNTSSILSVARDVTARKQAEAERELLQRQLVDASRYAGMAEVATGVLHNIGNVLNSVNVAATLCSDRLRNSKTEGLDRIVQLIAANRQESGCFFCQDDRGRAIPEYLQKLASILRSERDGLLAELSQVTRGIEHIKEVVRSQQAYGKRSTVLQPVKIQALIDDALMMALPAVDRSHIELIRQVPDLPELVMDKHKVLQVLVNLLSNAKHAVLDRTDHAPRMISVSVSYDPAQAQLSFAVTDSGIGIPAENLSRIFQHGFTTRAEGHGFGLHSAANAAREMGGTLTAESEGPGRGARFVLTIPTREQSRMTREAA
ncbi:MAG: PAS domain-containing protein [Phycisphaerae bacterium]|nr:PAS domain-containing protein [Phycisphaerae bacterium]MDW8260887.1 PAS domain-containing protein [Phycisphaerales bacterium]